MRILYLTGDNRMRSSAFSLFLPLWKELISCDIDFMETNTFQKYPNLRKDIFNGKDVPYLPKVFNSYIQNTYDIIVIENLFPYWNEDWSKIKAKKVMVLGDLHRFDPNGTKFPSFMSHIRDNVGVSAILTKYIESYHMIYKDVGLPVYHWPHSIDPTMFNYMEDIDKEYGVLSTGSMNSVYPVRQILHSKLKDKKYYKRIDRPNNNTITHPNPWPIGEDYVKELNKSMISIACTSKYHYTIAKIFEIPACGSVLLCDYTNEMKDLGFIPGENFIETRNTTIDHIEYLLNDNPDRLQKICERGHFMVHNNHTTKHRVDQFIRYMREII